MIKRITLSILSIFTFFAAKGQDTIPSTLANKITVFNHQYPREKAYLQLNKDIYSLRDTIWFKAYLVTALDNKLTDHSKVLYVDLINDRDSVIQAWRLPLISGLGTGSFSLPDHSAPGLYRVRAYTSWMKNFSLEYFFVKHFRVQEPGYNAPALLSAGKPVEIRDIKVNFFPEGGTIIEGIACNLGFRITDPDGRGIDAQGKILDKKQSQVATFQSAKNGIGAVKFLPQTDDQYTAVISIAGQGERSFSVPIAQKSGYAIHVENEDKDSVFINIRTTKDLLKKEEMTLMPVANGNPMFTFKTKFPDKLVELHLSKQKLPLGLIHLVLLNSKEETVAERLFFNEYPQQVKVLSTGLRPVYQKNENVSVELAMSTSNGKGVPGDFSVSVNRLPIDPEAGNAESLRNNLLLASDIKGYTPAENFVDGLSPDKARLLDQVLLVQSANYYIENTDQVKKMTFPVDQEVALSGKIKGMRKGSTAPVTVSLAADRPQGLTMMYQNDDSRTFKFMIPDSLLSAQYTVMVGKKGSTLEVLLDSMARPDVISASGNYVKQISQVPFIVDQPAAPVIVKEAVPVVKTPLAKTKISAASSAKITALEVKLADAATALAKLTAASTASATTGAVESPVKIPVTKGTLPKSKPIDSIKTKAPVSTPIVKEIPQIKTGPKVLIPDAINLNGLGNADKVIYPKDIKPYQYLSDALNKSFASLTIEKSATAKPWLKTAGPGSSPILVLVDGEEELVSHVIPERVVRVEFLKSPKYTTIYGVRGADGVLIINTERSLQVEDPAVKAALAEAAAEKKRIAAEKKAADKLIADQKLAEKKAAEQELLGRKAAEKALALSKEKEAVAKKETEKALAMAVQTEAQAKKALALELDRQGSLKPVEETIKVPVPVIAAAENAKVRATTSAAVSTQPKNIIKLKSPFNVPVAFHPFGSAVYWAPSLSTGTDGKAKFSFNTGSSPGTYQITLEGISKMGEPIRQLYRYEVK